ncbi:MAG: hypothetical protein GC160_23460 [Acidobacteria bacterium]|nr:hypothetical protein [Acidobacteriota bacterium]
MLCGAGPVAAQPVVFDGGVVNAASFLPASVPGGAIAQGSIFSVFGQEFGGEGLSVEAFPLPTELGGVSLEVQTNLGAVFRPFLLYVGTGQINAILPSDVPIGEHRLRVLRDGATSNTVRFKVVRSSVGIFGQEGFSYGMPRPAGAWQLSENPTRGDALTLWGTGLGPIDAPDSTEAPIGPVAISLHVFVAGIEAEVVYQGRSSCCAGLDQINIVIPKGAPYGCFVPVWAEIGGDMVSNVMTLALSPPDSGCEAFQDGNLSTWMVDAARIEMVRTFVQDGITDEITGIFVRRVIALAGNPSLPFRKDDLASSPPPGSCLIPTTPSYLNPFGLESAATTAIETPTGSVNLEALPQDGIPDAPGYEPGRPTHAVQSDALGLEPGLYRAETPGLDGYFPPFTAELDTGLPSRWVNREEPSTAPRDTGVTLEVQADGNPQRRLLVSLTGPSADPLTGPDIAVCRAALVNGRFSIPKAFLANIPDSTVQLGFTDAVTAPFEGVPEDFSTLFTHRRVQLVDLALGPPQLASTPVILPDGSEIQAEVAANFGERQRGLMARTVMPADQGMLFLFDESANWRFWMLGTLIPLDILWMDENREILYISADTPPCTNNVSCPTYGPSASSRYVLELNAGEAARRGLSVGDRLDW